MRTENSLKNVIITLISQFLKIILNFIVRYIFIKTLAEDFLGLDGLFSNILSMLSLVELGVGQAITYQLYKPLKENNIAKIKSLMNFFKKAYTAIGLIILIIGLSLNPFLKYFIKGEPNIIENIHLVYSLYVLTVALSYFMSYKRELINADQKMYISNIYIFICLFFMNIFQIVGMVITKKYFIFLLIKIVFILFENILLSKKASELYPFLKEKNIDSLTRTDMDVIKKNIVGAIFYKAGKVFVNSTDNIIISKIVGLTAVGIYSNYRLIISAVTNILTQIFSSITSSVGNLGVSASKEKIYNIFKKIYFIGFHVYSLCSICILFLINPFIKLWLGENYLFDNKIVVLISLNFLFTGISSIIGVFRDSFGLYWQGKLKPLFELLVNLVFSIILAYKYGVFGVLIGTLLSNLLINLWWEIKIIYNIVFKRKLTDYFILLSKYLISMVFIACLSLLIISKINISNLYLSIVFRLFIVVLLTEICYFIFYGKKEEYKYQFELIKTLFKKRSRTK